MSWAVKAQEGIAQHTNLTGGEKRALDRSLLTLKDLVFVCEWVNKGLVGAACWEAIQEEMRVDRKLRNRVWT